MWGEREGSTWKQVPVWVALTIALTVVAGIRLLPFRSVFRRPFVVLLGNDPYAYLHVVRQASAGGFAVESATGSYGLGEPLLIWVLTSLTNLVGGPPEANLVLALYPVLTAIFVGILVFVLAKLITNDARVGVTAVVVLAITPLHVSRTALGFADHHAFDSLLVLLVATTFTWLLVRHERSILYRWIIGTVLGVGIAAQTMAWEASPLLLLPVFIAVTLCSIGLIRLGESVERMGIIVYGFGVGAVLSQLIHHFAGWMSDFIATIPTLLFIVGIAILGLLYSIHLVDGSWKLLVLGEVILAGIGIVFLWVVDPEFSSTLTRRIGDFTAYIGFHQTTAIGETSPITQEFGPLLGFTIMLGFAPLLGLPALVWGLITVGRRNHLGLLILSIYAMWFLGLSFVQRRFAVHLAPFLAILAGIGFIRFIHWLQLIDFPLSFQEKTTQKGGETFHPIERDRLAILGTMGLIGTGFGGMISSQILSRLTIDSEAYNAATWIREFASQRDLTYPENYVLAHWGRVRMFNHFVNGNSRSYGFARNNYETFLKSADPDEWYPDFSGRVGFIVTRTLGDVSPTITQGLLHDRYGGGDEFVEGVRHYRAVWESESGNVKVFSVVPGAEIQGQAAPNSEISVSTTVDVPGNTEIQYTRFIDVGSDGSFTVGVPHPGTYQIANETLQVSESAVLNGNTYRIDVSVQA